MSGGQVGRGSPANGTVEKPRDERVLEHVLLLRFRLERHVEREVLRLLLVVELRAHMPNAFALSRLNGCTSTIQDVRVACALYI